MAFSLFKKKEKKLKADKRFSTLIVKKVVSNTKNAINLVFEKPSPFEYKPGQFITIIKEINGVKIRRAYSLCTSPFIDEHPAVTVKRVRNGVMSNYLNDHVKSGDTLEFMEPMGKFCMEYDPNQPKQIVFFAGGSGITPIISIIKTVLLKEPESQITLVYGNHALADIIFKDLIDELQKTYSSQFKVIHILEKKGGEYVGLPTPKIIGEICETLKCNNKTTFYICGPQAMMDVVNLGLSKQEYPPENIIVESFDSNKVPKIQENSGSYESEILIILDGEKYAITANKSTPILTTALNKNLDMPYSCQSGICTACRGKCLEGEVSTDEVEGLSAEEIAAGYVLTCVGKPISNRIKIEIG